MKAPNNRKVLLIGWDAADWKLIHQFVDDGKMPNMAKFIEEGVIGNLATLFPELSPMLWTSIATGKRPYKHGILGFTEPDPHGGGVRPITNLSRKTKAIWNIMNQFNKKSIVLGWWPSHPAEPINGVMVSNHYQRAISPHGKPWPMRPGTVHPERLIKNLSDLRLHPQDLDPGLVMKFVPGLADIDQEKDKRIESLAKVIADSTTINRAATAIMHHETWDFAAIYYDAIDHFGHGFMQYHPPRLKWINEQDFERYRNVVEGGYIYHDLLLGTLLEKAGKDTTTIIVSDHGFHSDHLRPRHIPVEPAGPAVQHRPYGIFAARGPGIKKDEIIYGANLLDIAPTILTMYGLPVGEDMDGKPLVNIFEVPLEIKTIASWDDVPGEDGTHPPEKAMDPIEAKEALDQLVELGYIDRPDENVEKAAEDTVRELKYNLARSYMDAGHFAEGMPVLEELLDKWPDEYRFGIQLITCYHKLAMTSKARPLLEKLLKTKDSNMKKAAKELKEFKEKHKDTQPGELDEKEQRRLRKLNAETSRSPFAMEYLMGCIVLEEGKYKEALKHLEKAEQANSSHPGLYSRIGDVYLRMKRWTSAIENYNKTLEIDPESPDAYLGLANIYLKTKNNAEAAELALDSIGLRFHNPNAHLALGTALHRLGRLKEAVEALNVTVAQSPYHAQAHSRLAMIYKRRLGNKELAAKHKALASESRAITREFKKTGVLPGLDKEAAAHASLTSSDIKAAELLPPAPDGPMDPKRTVVVVTGLPRTGTSMMMQMLKAAGVEPYTDSKREPDEDNPRGYYEHTKAPGLARDSTWIPEARGKAVKIVAQLLEHLPHTEGIDYRVIFMERDLDEVLASQLEMLRRKGRDGKMPPKEVLVNTFSRQLNRSKVILATRRLPTVFIDYSEAVSNPRGCAHKLKGFLGGPFDENKAAGAIDPKLKRQTLIRT